MHGNTASCALYMATKWLLQSWDVHKQGRVDPFAIAEPELESVSERLRRSLLTDIPALGRAAEYFFQVCKSTVKAGYKHYWGVVPPFTMPVTHS